jgi:hypothetical protein
MQREYFLSLFDGRFDADYFESRLRVGDAHQRIALRTLVADTGDGARILPTVEALIKAARTTSPIWSSMTSRTRSTASR